MNSIKLILLSICISLCTANKNDGFDTNQYLDRFNTLDILIEGTPQYEFILKNKSLIPFTIDNIGIDKSKLLDSIWIIEQEDSLTIFDRFYQAGYSNRFFIYKEFKNDTVFIRTPHLTEGFVEIINEDTNVSFLGSPQESIFLLKTKIVKTSEIKTYPVIYKNIKILN